MTKNTKRILLLASFFVLLVAATFLYFKTSDKTNSKKDQKDLSLNDKWFGEEYPKFNNLDPVIAKKFLISTSDQLASKAGEKILKKGGNVIDAVIAAQMVLNVVEPQSSGIGGGAFLAYYDAKTKQTYHFNGRETAPLDSYSKMFLDDNNKPMQFHNAVQGGLSVGTPGLLKMLKLVHDKYGRIAWKDLFDDAIQIASQGFTMDKKIHTIAQDLSYLKEFKDFSNIYLKEDGKPKDIGQKIINPQLANSLQTIANKGIKPFYEGKIAQNIVNKVQNSPINPGYLSLKDMKNYQPIEDNLICGFYRQYKICSSPIPSSGALTLLQTLGILENFNLKKYDSNSVEAIHLISQATRLAYADRNKYIGDIDNVPINKMLDSDYLKSRSKLIKINKIINDILPGKFNHKESDYAINNNSQENPSTTHISAIDQEGNAIAMTSSIEYLFGSALMVNGFLLNNQLTDFSFIPEINGTKVANRLEPEKQPRSSMSPTFIFDKNDELLLILGSPGGPRIIQYVLKTIIAYIDWNMDIITAVNLPNFTILRNKLELEKGTRLEKIKDNLVQLGHNVKIRNLTSGINAIAIDHENKILIGAADYRKKGFAAGK